MTEVPVDTHLAGQRVLITAAASGIGRRIAESFLRQDCSVHICDVDQVAIDQFLTANPSATATLADVADPVMIDRVFEDLESNYDGLDILVNNAGVAGPVAAAEDIDPEDWERTIAVNLSSHFLFARKAIPLLKQSGGGSIISIASSAAFHGCPLRTPYAASKWSLIGLTKTLAMELGPFGIRVNAVCPGSVDGERIQAVMEKDAQSQGKTIEEIRDGYLRQSSMRTFVAADDVANMILFLVSGSGAKISGQALGLDGHTESFAI